MVVCEAVAVSCLPNGENSTGDSASLEVVWGLRRELWDVPQCSRRGTGEFAESLHGPYDSTNQY